MLNLATTSNSAKGISAKAFRPTVKQPRVKHDLVFSDGKFTISGKFLKDQLEHQGWNVDYTPGSDRVLLVQTVSEEKSGFGLFLKGDKPSAKFKSDAVEFSFKEGGLDFDQPFTLTLLPEEEDTIGFNVFVVTTEDADSEDDADDDLEPATPFTVTTNENGVITGVLIEEGEEVPSLDIVEEDDTVGITDAPITEEEATAFTQEQVDAYAQTGPEEQPNADAIEDAQDITLL